MKYFFLIFPDQLYCSISAFKIKSQLLFFFFYFTMTPTPQKRPKDGMCTNKFLFMSYVDTRFMW